MELLVIGKEKLSSLSRMAVCLLSAACTAILAAYAGNPNTVVTAKAHGENPLLVGVFATLNYVSGIAIVGAMIFGGIWLFQKKGLVDELPTQTMPAPETESVPTNETKSEA